MIVEKLLDQIERRLTNKVTQVASVNRYELRELLNETLAELASMEQWEFLKKHLLLAQTEEGVRNYDLPEDFPTNFLHSFDPPDTDVVNYSVQLDDGSTASSLTYETVDQFYQRNLSAESNSRPSHYTIVSSPSGVRQIALGPPPDSTSYTISGTYIPNEFNMNNRDSLPLMPSNHNVLRYGVLRQAQPRNQRWEAEYMRSLQHLYYTQAKLNPASFVVERPVQTRKLIT
jgi:hypothetical protein|tara:strand:- start:237 stop:926 length:690 start_codon:yes stop_codon:yes gene_type:complete